MSVLHVSLHSEFGCCYSFSGVFLFVFFTPFRYHGQSDEVGCFVAARPLTRRNRYYEVGDCHLFFYDSVTINIKSSDLCRTQNSFFFSVQSVFLFLFFCYVTLYYSYHTSENCNKPLFISLCFLAASIQSHWYALKFMHLLMLLLWFKGMIDTLCLTAQFTIIRTASLLVTEIFF